MRFCDTNYMLLAMKLNKRWEDVGYFVGQRRTDYQSNVMVTQF